MSIPRLQDYNPTSLPQGLRLQDAALLLQHEYLPLESGYGLTPDGMMHVAASTYMRGCSGEMIEWWFGYIHTTEQYLLWHPRDHIFSDWDGPRDNESVYVGGKHLVHEYIGGQLSKLAIHFQPPTHYFGPNWKQDLQAAGYSAAVCGRVGDWNDDGSILETGHLIHLIKDEPDGCRMRSRFWLGDVAGITEAVQRAGLVPASMAAGLCKHATEEMAILATRLPGLYSDFAKPSSFAKRIVAQ